MTIDIVHTALDRLTDMGAQGFTVELTLHDVSEQDAGTIVKHFPDLDWTGHKSGGTDWLNGRSANLSVTLFLETNRAPKPEPVRANQILAAARA